MIWKFGNIDFDAFGVKISHTTGLLDLPKMQITGTDWLDEDGKDYWQEETKYNDREIVLNCWLASRPEGQLSGYETFKSKVEAFSEAIRLAGKATLSTPYIDIENCSISRGITVAKETSYLSDLQAGVFTLRITVHGDSVYGSYPVYDWATFEVKTVLVTKTMKVQRTLQGDNYATCTVETNVPMSIHMYDTVFLNTNGLNSEPYYFMGEPDVRKLSSNKYQYNVRLEHGSILLRQTRFLFEGESDFPLYANMETIVGMVCDNNRRFIWDQKFRKGTIAQTENRNHIFKGEDCLSVLKRLSHEYGLEYDIRWTTPGAYYTIDVVEQIASTKSITLEYGKGKGLYEISRDPVDKNDLVTVLYTYGSTKNLKPDYRGGKRRLEFTGNPLRMNDSEYMGIEDTVFFDEIFPNRTANVTGYSQILPIPDDPAYEQIKQVWPGGWYRIEDATLDFDLNDYLLGGLTAKIRMKTGNLAGMEFEIKRYDHANKHIYIIPFKDERGKLFPNDLMQIEVGDEYTLIDIDQPESYVQVAESKLHDAAVEVLERRSSPRPPYSVQVHPAFVKGLTERFNVGDRITVTDIDIDVNGLYRISSFTYDPLMDSYQVKLSENRILTKREQLEIRVSNTERAIEFTNSDKGETVKKDQETTNELKNRIFNPADDLQDLDKTVRNESVDPRMLSYDAGVPQFSLKNALVEVNYEGDFNKVRVYPGQLIMHNYTEKTKTRFEIKQMKDSSLSYDPTRTWNIPDTIINLTSASGYFLYAKLNLATGSTEAELIWEQDHVEVKDQIDEGFLKYKLGHISDQSSPRSAAMLWGNVKQIGASASDLAVITQASHGFSVGTAIRHNGTHYVMAQADNDTNAQACGVVSAVIDGNQFRYISDGFLPGDWIPGAEYFLSPYEAGKLIILSDPEVWEMGQVRLSMGFGTSKGLKVEIDVGDVIEDLPTVRLVGIWDREFEFCFNAGYEEVFVPDRWAVYEYEILEAILECDEGSVDGVSIRIDGVPVGGLENLTVGTMARTYATGNNKVLEGAKVTLHIPASFTGSPSVIAGKLKILRS